MTTTDTYRHQYYMQQAIELAKKGLYTTRPNPRVGCVIVKDNKIVGRGYHYQAGEPHAEVFALREAAEQACNATVYVTLEPCSHYGRTPPCADALIAAGVATVVIAVTDPNPKVSGRGIDKLKQAGIDVITDVCYEQAYTLNPGFLRTMAGGLPYIRIKLACSMDGRIAMASGESQWITSEAARIDGQRLRAMSSAIITGSQTVITDQPLLNVRSDALGVPIEDVPQPVLVVLDRRQRISASSDWYQMQQRQRPIILVQQADIDLVELLQGLQRIHQVQEILIEAGAGVTTAFLKAGLVDELIVYQAPCILGNTAKAMTDLNFDNISQQLRFSQISCEPIGNDLKIIYRALS